MKTSCRNSRIHRAPVEEEGRTGVGKNLGCHSWKLKHQEKSLGVMFPARPRTRQSPPLALHPPSLVVPSVCPGFLAVSLSSSLFSPWQAPGGVCTELLTSVLLSHCLTFHFVLCQGSLVALFPQPNLLKKFISIMGYINL